MNRELAERVADAVLYEGYMLYPYRASAIKNRQRWSFGILYPAAFEEVVRGTESSVMHTECLLAHGDRPALHARLRFLHLLTNQVDPRAGSDCSSRVGSEVERWEEGATRTVDFALPALGNIPESLSFEFPGQDLTELLAEDAGRPAASVVRTQHAVRGSLTLFSKSIGDGLLRLVLEIRNETDLPGDASDRNRALMGALVSAHCILSVKGAEFVSLLDPPPEWRAAAARCKNMGNFPVLVGDAGERDMLLCSPILLYDYPQIAPESAGDFFDATEIDEMLTLRVMTLSEEEKKEIRQGDGRTRALLERTERTAREQLMRRHGAARSLRRSSELE